MRAAFALFVVTTGIVLLLGHSLGSHRKLIHDSFQCPSWLEYALVYCGVQVGLAGPLGLLRQHELRDYAQRLPVATISCATAALSGSMHGGNSIANCACAIRRAIRSRRASPTTVLPIPRANVDAAATALGACCFPLGRLGLRFLGRCARVTAGVFGHWLIGYFAHNQGGCTT